MHVRARSTPKFGRAVHVPRCLRKRDLACSQPCTTATCPHLITQVRGVASRTAIHYQSAGRDSTFNPSKESQHFQPCRSSDRQSEKGSPEEKVALNQQSHSLGK